MRSIKRKSTEGQQLKGRPDQWAEVALLGEGWWKGSWKWLFGETSQMMQIWALYWAFGFKQSIFRLLCSIAWSWIIRPRVHITSSTSIKHAVKLSVGFLFNWSERNAYSIRWPWNKWLLTTVLVLMHKQALILATKQLWSKGYLQNISTHEWIDIIIIWSDLHPITADEVEISYFALYL